MITGSRLNWSLGQEKPGREGGRAGITVEARPRREEAAGGTLATGRLARSSPRRLWALNKRGGGQSLAEEVGQLP